MMSLSQRLDTLRRLASLPSAHLIFERHIEPENVTATYRYYTMPHPRYRIIQHKRWGAALIDLQQFASHEAYLERIKGRNGGAHHARRARSRGYVLADIDRNEHLDAIHAINTAIDARQGRPMDDSYRCKRLEYERLANYQHVGVFNGEGRLMAYADVGRFGNFCAFSRLIGYRNNDGFMHLAVVDIVARLLLDPRVRYLMYDTFFGALPGMQQFKTVLGFAPYRVRYSLQ